MSFHDELAVACTDETRVVGAVGEEPAGVDVLALAAKMPEAAQHAIRRNLVNRRLKIVFREREKIHKRRPRRTDVRGKTSDVYELVHHLRSSVGVRLVFGHDDVVLDTYAVSHHEDAFELRAAENGDVVEIRAQNENALNFPFLL